MMDAAGINSELKAKLWCEAFKTGIDIFNLTSNCIGEKCKEEKWSGEMPKYSADLRTFGESGVVKKMIF